MNQEFKDTINKIRYRSGLNQAQIAERVGVKKSYISDVLGGRAPYSDSLRKKINNAFPEFELRSDGSDKIDIPLLPVLAHAGHLVDFSEAVMDYDCEKITTPLKGAEIAVPIYGESMTPEFPSGSIVFVKRIDESAFIEWGKCYILDTVNGSIIKYLAPGEGGNVRCISANPDPMYAPFEVKKTDILGIYKVLMCMSMK